MEFESLVQVCVCFARRASRVFMPFVCVCLLSCDRETFAININCRFYGIWTICSSNRNILFLPSVRVHCTRCTLGFFPFGKTKKNSISFSIHLRASSDRTWNGKSFYECMNGSLVCESYNIELNWNSIAHTVATTACICGMCG